MNENRSNAILGTVLGVGLAIASFIGYQQWKYITPASDWIEINILHIEDAQPGEDPRITYDRQFKMDVAGVWAVNVFKYQDKADSVGVLYCSGSGTSSYKEARPLPPTATKLSWLMGRENNPCVLEKGIYKAIITIIISPIGYPTKVVEKESNFFLVPPQEEK